MESKKKNCNQNSKSFLIFDELRNEPKNVGNYCVWKKVEQLVQRRDQSSRKYKLQILTKRQRRFLIFDELQKVKKF